MIFRAKSITLVSSLLPKLTASPAKPSPPQRTKSPVTVSAHITKRSRLGPVAKDSYVLSL